MDRANSRAGPSNPPTIVGRLSRLLRPSQITASSSSSTITTTPGKTFVVPLFLSTSRPSTRNNLFGQGTLPPTSRSLSSRQARIDNRMPRARDLPPSSTRRPDVDEGSDMYTASDPDGQTPAALDSGPRARNTDDVRSTSSSRGTCSVRSGAVIRSGRSSARSGSPSTNSSRGASRSTNSSSRVQSRRRVVRSASAKSNHDSRVSAKARISFAFGITLLIAMVIYVVLAFTRTARGVMFHVLSILLILTLAGVFFHQFLSMLMLKRRHAAAKRRNGTLHTPRHRHRQRRGPAPGPRSVADTDEMPPEKPIQIHMGYGHDGGDDYDNGLGPDLEAGNLPPTVPKPPPTYGNTRTSMRINPNFVYTKQVDVVPSPLTPTYDEAMTQVQHSVGYRPPSYLSDGGASEVIASQRRDVDAALENIHPLERERMRTLAAEALEGRGVGHREI